MNKRDYHSAVEQITDEEQAQIDAVRIQAMTTSDDQREAATDADLARQDVWQDGWNTGWEAALSSRPALPAGDEETVAEVAGWIRDDVFAGRDARESLYPVSERLAARIVAALASRPIPLADEQTASLVTDAMGHAARARTSENEFGESDALMFERLAAALASRPSSPQATDADEVYVAELDRAMRDDSDEVADERGKLIAEARHALSYGLRDPSVDGYGLIAKMRDYLESDGQGQQ